MKIPWQTMWRPCGVCASSFLHHSLMKLNILANNSFRLASKYMYKRLDDAARHNYLEMGLLSITFVLKKNEKGVWEIQV